MKKILLFVAGLMLAMTASAAVVVAGNGKEGNPWCNGENWNANSTTNVLVDGSITYNDVPAGTYEFKLVIDGNWTSPSGIMSSASTQGYIKGDNLKFVTTTTSNITIAYDGSSCTLTSSAGAFGEEVLSVWTIAGVKELVSPAWTPNAAANDMVSKGNGIFELVTENISLEGGIAYEYKAVANHDWSTSVPDGAGNASLTVDATGVYNITYTLNANTKELSVVATLVTGGGEEGGDQGGEEGGEEGGDDPIVTPTGADYYLIGYINGADYGDKDDYQNLGDYKFVDGSLVATFEANSYVAIKTGDLSKWYFAEAYTEETSVILEEGKNFGEKLFVPGGVEVTFTLVENADGSLTLSYTTGTTTDLEDIDAEDAVVAAYDLIGRPVAADAKGLVILQYASGKAVKVYNN